MLATQLTAIINECVKKYGNIKVTHPMNEGNFKVNLLDENGYDETECRRQKITFKPVEIYIE